VEVGAGKKSLKKIRARFLHNGQWGEEIKNYFGFSLDILGK